MTVIQPNSISGINSITVATGEALQVHAANGDIVSTIVSSSGIATYKAIHVGSGTTTSNQGISVGTGASITSTAVNTLSFYTNNVGHLSIDNEGKLSNIGLGAEINVSSSSQDTTATTGQFYTSVSGKNNKIQVKTYANGGGDPYLKFDGGGTDMVVGERYVGTTNNLLILGPGDNPSGITSGAVFVKGTGDVGVGTDPARTFQVFKGNGNPQINLKSATGGTCELQFGDCADEVRANIIYNNTDNYLGFNGYNNSERMRILTGGEVLIGRTAKPNDINKLVVTGTSPADTYDSQLYLEGNETTGAVNTGGALAFGGHDGGSYRNWANIYGMKENATSGNTAAYMAFHTRPAGGSPTENMRIHSHGVVSFNNGIELGSGLDSTGANILDDYEEGQFTPFFGAHTGNGSVTHTAQYGFYQKVGCVVHAWIDMTCTAWSGASGQAEIGGLPFAKNELLVSYYYTGTTNWYIADALCDTKPVYTGWMPDGDTAIRTYKGDSWGSTASAPINTTGRVAIYYVYTTSS